MIARYRSSAAPALNLTPESRDYLRVPSHTSYNLNLGYRINDNARLNLSVVNVTDDKMDFPVIVNALGRSYMLMATTKF